MIENGLASRGPDLLDSGQTGRDAFNQWLRTQLKARKLSQRQLAQKSGVDHSTISRLMRGERMPSLRTAAMLARGLGMAQELGRLQTQVGGKGGSAAARVEYALRSDDLLDNSEVRRIMNVYLAARLRHLAAGAIVPAESPTRMPVPIVVPVPDARLLSTSGGRRSTSSRDRSS
jgi:transcriptional regulator with XRE-family HTH domain